MRKSPHADPDPLLLWLASALGAAPEAFAQSDHRWLSAQLLWDNDTLPELPN